MVVSNRMLIYNPTRQNFLFAQSGRCFYCHGRINAKTATRDHLFPKLRLRGHGPRRGKGAHMNIVLCCEACNRKKGHRLPSGSEIYRARKMYAALGKPAFEIG